MNALKSLSWLLFLFWWLCLLEILSEANAWNSLTVPTSLSEWKPWWSKLVCMGTAQLRLEESCKNGQTYLKIKKALSLKTTILYQCLYFLKSRNIPGIYVHIYMPKLMKNKASITCVKKAAHVIISPPYKVWSWFDRNLLIKLISSLISTDTTALCCAASTIEKVIESGVNGYGKLHSTTIMWCLTFYSIKTTTTTH